MAFQSVPNQRLIRVNKAITDTINKYTKNNLSALDEAAKRLQSKGGFKLYMYLAKNQHHYEFALSSSAFCEWSGLGMTAYNSAFKELREEGYLIPKDSSNEKETRFLFYDKSQIPAADDQQTIIENEKEKVEDYYKIKELIEAEESEFQRAVVLW